MWASNRRLGRGRHQGAERAAQGAIVKIDTEGSEIDILSRMTSLDFDVIMLEYHSEANRRKVEELFGDFFSSAAKSGSGSRHAEIFPPPPGQSCRLGFCQGVPGTLFPNSPSIRYVSVSAQPSEVSMRRVTAALGICSLLVILPFAPRGRPAIRGGRRGPADRLPEARRRSIRRQRPPGMVGALPVHRRLPGHPCLQGGTAAPPRRCAPQARNRICLYRRMQERAGKAAAQAA